MNTKNSQVWGSSVGINNKHLLDVWNLMCLDIFYNAEDSISIWFPWVRSNTNNI